MLDVHPPEHAAHTWRDFFIHIATIVVGLLIAIALEQSVEWLSHQHEIKETRKALAEERKLNIERFHLSVHFARRQRAEFENDLRIFQYLQLHPGTPAADLPGVLMWGQQKAGLAEASWNSAIQSNVLGLMPRDEVEESRDLYAHLQAMDEREKAVWEGVNKATAYRFLEPDANKLSPAQIDAEIPLIEDCLRLTFLQTVELNNIGILFLDFAPYPIGDDLRIRRGAAPKTTPEENARAQAFTDRDLAQADALEKAEQAQVDFMARLDKEGTLHGEELYRAYRAQNPQAGSLEDPLVIHGYQLLSTGKVDAAITIFQLATKLFPSSSNTYDSLGDAYAQAHKNALAIESYQTAVKLDPAAKESIRKLHDLQH